MIQIDLWLYGPLARFGGDADQGSHAHLEFELPDGATVQDLLDRLGMPLEKKGITFINRQLSDMPGVGSDLGRELMGGDRVAIFHEKSMWPYQYRHDAVTSDDLKQAIDWRGQGLRHSYAPPQQDEDADPS